MSNIESKQNRALEACCKQPEYVFSAAERGGSPLLWKVEKMFE